MTSHAQRVNTCKASVKKSVECIKICQKCSEICTRSNGITSDACQACVNISNECLILLQDCFDQCKQHSDTCCDENCLKYMKLFLEKSKNLIAAKKERSHYCNTDNVQCTNSYNKSVQACKEFIQAYNDCFYNSCDGCCGRCNK